MCQLFKNLEEDTGVKIQLAFEPEPDCYLETTDEAIEFFKLLNNHLDFEQMKYLGVCLDTCHSALQFENPLENLKKYKNANIPVSKIQISAAPRLNIIKKTEVEVLEPFSEPVYLHQTRVLAENKILKVYPDLPEALDAGVLGEWRCHFHIPLHFQGQGILNSTNIDLNEDFLKKLGEYVNI